MCLGVFIASDRPLSLVPWSQEARGFNVAPLSHYEEPVRAQFSLPHVVYAGAHTRCACGFQNDAEEPLSVERSRAALLAYLGKAADVGRVELFVCWDGDFAQAARFRFDRSVGELHANDEWLQELAFTSIRRR
jgi:hypothetical protein